MKNFFSWKAISLVALAAVFSTVVAVGSVFAVPTAAPNDNYVSPQFNNTTVNSVLNVIGSIVNPTAGQPVVVNDDLSITNATPSTRKGLMLQAADRPMLTNGYDPFSGSGSYGGIGRWGIFMEPFRLTFGIATPSTGTPVISATTRYFAFKKFAGDPGTGAVAAGTDLMRLGSDGVLDVLGSIKNANASVLVDDDLQVTGSTSVNSLTVAGAANIGGNLAVTGTTTVSNLVAGTASADSLSATNIAGGTYTGGINAGNFKIVDTCNPYCIYTTLSAKATASLSVSCPTAYSALSCQFESSDLALYFISSKINSGGTGCDFSVYNSSPLLSKSLSLIDAYATCVKN